MRALRLKKAPHRSSETLMSTRSGTAKLFARPDVSVRIGASLFIAGAALSVGTMLAPHSQVADEVGFYWLGLAELMIGLTALALRGATARRVAPPLFVIGGIAVVSASLYFNGEADGGAATLSEFYYVWPALYAGYFFERRAIMALLALCALAYAGTLAAILADPSIAFTRWVVTMSVVAGAAGALHALKLHVDGLMGALHATARTDPLTGMLNRRGFAERFDLEVERAARTTEPFALVLGDIDHFKALNDEYGHIAGDEALAEIGEALRAGCRTIDTAARIGGEEFALLLPGTGSSQAYEAAERLREAVGALTGPDGDHLTISFGVVEHPAHGAEWSDLMRGADAALYEAKASGRNRTVALRAGLVQVA
jgi:diguanylate cyclase (GGDEF)-like protein